MRWVAQIYKSNCFSLHFEYMHVLYSFDIKTIDFSKSISMLCTLDIKISDFFLSVYAGLGTLGPLNLHRLNINDLDTKSSQNIQILKTYDVGISIYGTGWDRKENHCYNCFSQFSQVHEIV